MPLLLKVILIFGAEMLLKLLRCHSSQHCLLQINEDMWVICVYKGKRLYLMLLLYLCSQLKCYTPDQDIYLLARTAL